MKVLKKVTNVIASPRSGDTGPGSGYLAALPTPSGMGLGRARTRRRVRPVERFCSAVRICGTCVVVFTESRSVEKSDSHQLAAYQRFHTARVIFDRSTALSAASP